MSRGVIVIEFILIFDEFWFVMEFYWKEKGFVRQYFDLYNVFIDYGFQDVVNEFGEVVLDILNFKVKFGKICIGQFEFQEVQGQRRFFYLMDVRIRNLIYFVLFYFEMIFVVNGIEQEFVEVRIGEFLIMFKFKVCRFYGLSDEEFIKFGEDLKDFGGYFIINGFERVIVFIEDFVLNKIFVERDERQNKVVVKVFLYRYGYRVFIIVERKKDGIFYVMIFNVLKFVKFVYVMCVFGFFIDKEIVEVVSDDLRIQQVFFDNFEDVSDISIQEEVFDYIGRFVFLG